MKNGKKAKNLEIAKTLFRATKPEIRDIIILKGKIHLLLNLEKR